MPIPDSTNSTIPSELPAINREGSLVSSPKPPPDYTIEKQPETDNTAKRNEKQDTVDGSHSNTTWTETGQNSIMTNKPKLQDLATATESRRNETKPQFHKEYIETWSITPSNLEIALKDIVYCIDRLKEASLDDLILDAHYYYVDFYLVTKGCFRKYCAKKDCRKKVVIALLDNGWMEFLQKYYEHVIISAEKVIPPGALDSYPVSERGHIWKTEGVTVNKRLLKANLNFFQGSIAIWNGTDIREQDLLQRIYDVWMPFMLREFNRGYLYPVVTASHGGQYKTVRSFLGTMHNFAHKLENGVTSMRVEKDLLGIVLRYVEDSSHNISVKAIIVMSYLIEEGADASVIKLDEREIRYLLDVLENAMKSTNHYSKKFGYNAEEIIEALINISVLDMNKTLLIDGGFLPLLVKSLSSDCVATHQAAAAKAIWTLAFDGPSKSKCMEEPGCLEGLHTLLKTEDENAKRAAEGALWSLEGEQKHLQHLKNSPSAVPSTRTKHIMLSYNWGVQKEVFKLREILKANGYKVWIDVEQMSGSTLEAMSKAVEEAALILIFFSEKYKLSAACRSEAEYAYKLNKEFIPIRMQSKYIADGWLGMLLGTKFFYDLTKPNIYESKIKDLLEAIGTTGKLAPGEVDEIVYSEEPTSIGDVGSAPAQPVVNIPTVPRAPAHVLAYPSVRELKCWNWSNQEVQDWLQTSDLQKYQSQMQEVDGQLLAELISMSIVSNDVYYSVIREELKMPMTDLLKLNRALRSAAS